MSAIPKSYPLHMDAPQAPQLSGWFWNRPYLLLTLAACLWASNFVIGRMIPSSMAPVSLSFWRWILALPIVLPFAWPHLKADLPALRRGWPILTLLAALGLAGSNTIAYTGLRLTDATSALLVQSAMPTAIVAFGFLLFRERIRSDQLIAMAFALTGVLSVILAKPGASGALNMGTVLASVAMLSQALYATLLRRRPLMHPTSFLFLTFAAAALIMLPFQWVVGTPLPVGDMRGMAALGYLAIGPSVLAFFLFNRGVALVGSGRAGLFFYLMPVFGTIFAALFLGEWISGIELGGFLLVGLGFALSRRKEG